MTQSKTLSRLRRQRRKKVLAKAKEDAARKAEIDAAKEAVKKAKEDYETALRVCHEALARWSAAERELVVIEKRNRSATCSSQTYDDFKRLIEKWFLI